MSALATTIRIARRSLTRHRARTGIMLVAIAVFVALSVALDAFASGFYGAMTEVAVGQTLGEVQVHATGHLPARAVDRNLDRALAASVAAADGVRVVAPRVRVHAMASTANGARPVDLIGAEAGPELAFGTIADRITSGQFLQAGDDDTAVVAAGLADALDLEIGSDLHVMAAARDGAPTAMRFEIVGLLRGDGTAARLVYVPAPALRSHLGLSASAVTELALRVEGDPDDAAARVREICARPACVVETWQQREPGLAAAMTTDHNFLRATYGLFVLIAGIMVLNLQLMTVLERTRELGMLLAIGVTPGRLIAMLMAEAAFVGMAGIAAGLALGMLAVAGMSGGVDIASYVADAGTVSGIALVPVVYPRMDAVLLSAVCGGLLVTTVLAAIGSAFRLRSMNPITAMQRPEGG